MLWQLLVVALAHKGQSCIDSMEPSFAQETLNQFGDLTFNEFVANFNQLDVGLGQSHEEQFRVYKRECYLFGDCNSAKQRQVTRVKPTNNFDSDETCPDSVTAEPWDYDDHSNVVIGANRIVLLDHSVDIINMTIHDGAVLIFKDLGADRPGIDLSRKKAVWLNFVHLLCYPSLVTS